MLKLALKVSVQKWSISTKMLRWAAFFLLLGAEYITGFSGRDSQSKKKNSEEIKKYIKIHNWLGISAMAVFLFQTVLI